MRLSDVPFEELKCTQNWVISATGVRGTIIDISAMRKGIDFEVWLTIIWSDPNLGPSMPEWPHQCNNLTIDPPAKTVCPNYVTHRLAALEKQAEYLRAMAKPDS